jgi:hypothetical protein
MIFLGNVERETNVLGVDYTHPSLGGGFGPGYKIVGGYDFVGDDYDG